MRLTEVELESWPHVERLEAELGRTRLASFTIVNGQCDLPGDGQ